MKLEEKYGPRVFTGSVVARHNVGRQPLDLQNESNDINTALNSELVHSLSDAQRSNVFDLLRKMLLYINLGHHNALLHVQCLSIKGAKKDLIKFSVMYTIL